MPGHPACTAQDASQSPKELTCIYPPITVTDKSPGFVMKIDLVGSWSSAVSQEDRKFMGAKRLHKQNDLKFWCQGPIQRRNDVL